MSAQVVVVLDDAEAVQALTNAIRENGHTVQPFTDPMQAMDALERAKKAELLITGVQFPTGKGNGHSLALMARHKRPAIKLIFLCHPRDEEHIGDLGRCLPLPVDVPKVVELAEQLLAEPAERGERATNDQETGISTERP